MCPGNKHICVCVFLQVVVYLYVDCRAIPAFISKAVRVANYSLPVRLWLGLVDCSSRRHLSWVGEVSQAHTQITCPPLTP